MKSILTTIVFLTLAISGLAQTRSVIVNTSGVVQSPTNFWSADVTNARSGLGLGTAATNPATAFQPSSLVLSNLTSSNAVNLTNLRATNIVGTLSLTQGGTGSTNASDARTAFGLGTASTNSASAFQPSSLALSNLASSNGSALTNLTAANVTGTIAISNGGTGATTAGGARTNLGLGTTNAVTFGGITIAESVLTLSEEGENDVFVSNENADLALQATAGSGLILAYSPISFVNTTNAATTRAFLGLGLSALTNTNTTDFRTAIGLGTTNKVSFDAVSAKQSTGFSSTTLNGIQWQNMYPSSNGLIGLYGSDAEGTTTFGINIGTMSGTTAEVALFNANKITFYEPLEFNNTTNAATTRTNLGLGSASSVTFSSLSLSNGALTNLAITLGATNRGFSATSGPERIITTVAGVSALTVFSNQIEMGTSLAISGGPLSFSGANAASNSTTTRTNLGLGWSALTNSNAGTGLVSVSTNGEVVSPTNFWQVAPIVTRFVEFDPATNATTNIVAARNLHIHSLAISRTGVTSTIALPITNSFNGDIALVVHQGPTSSATAVRVVGAATNLVTLSRPEEAVEFVYYNNVWQFNHNQSFIEPIFFSGTNAAGHAAESRTNLGLGLPALTNTSNTNFQAAVFATNTTPTNAGNFNTHAAWMEVTVQTNGSNVSFRIPLYK